MNILIGGYLLLSTALAGNSPATGPGADQGDAYFLYVKNAPEFEALNLRSESTTPNWTRWLYMPWRYEWTIGIGDEAGLFCRNFGIEGGVLDYGKGPIEWIEKWNLSYYNAHTAGKGYLFLRPHDFRRLARRANVIRQGPDGLRPIDRSASSQLKKTLKETIGTLRRSPLRVAYSLDDEISWGSMIKPLPWKLNADETEYREWLQRYYGGEVSPKRRMTPDEAFDQLDRPLGEIDLAPLLDPLTFNDSLWANFVGELVSYANQLDPKTPTGFTGAQAPNIWGGYDYAKLAKKVQFMGVYDQGSAREIVRSLSAGRSIFRVTTHFHQESSDGTRDVWQAWRQFAHGHRGMIGWVEGWFDGEEPRPWLQRFGATLKEIGSLHGQKLIDAEWIHDGVAIYYSHPSIQVSWVLDSEAHGRTWMNRNNDQRLGTSHNVRKAWELMLNDSGVQYDFIAYDEVVVNGIPSRYKVLILPAVFALSDVEATRIKQWVYEGGTVIADFACGLFDQHGRGRPQGILDDLFGVRHDGTETREDFFGRKLWVETDQDKGYEYRTYDELFKTVKTRLHKGFSVAERRLGVGNEKQYGAGRGLYLNLSPQRYLQYRQEEAATSESRNVFLEPLGEAGVRARVTIDTGSGESSRTEVTYWCKDSRTLLFAFASRLQENRAREARQMPSGPGEMRIEFAVPASDVRNERTGQRLGDVSVVDVPFVEHEAVFLSFRGCPDN